MKETLQGIRVRFYFQDLDKDLWKLMPCRVNEGDSFYIDTFFTEEDEKLFTEEEIDWIYNEGTVLKCTDTIFGTDKHGIYQQVYLSE